MFMLFDDPEGPNLLIVVVMALVLYGVSAVAYQATFPNPKKLWLAVLIQVVAALTLYFCLR